MCNKSNEKRAAIFCRLDRNGNDQSHRIALSMQLKLLELYARKRGINIVGRYFDMGYSRVSEKLPDRAALRKDYADGKFDTVIYVNTNKDNRRHNDAMQQWSYQVCTIS